MASIRKLQRIVEKDYKDEIKNNPKHYHVTMLAEGSGNLASAMLENNFTDTGDALAELVWVTMLIANKRDIDLESAFKKRFINP